jgi:DNA-binding Xre family transcriptional regulator
VTGPDYEWKLRELMALRGMFKTTDLVKPLAERGIERDRTQVYRLVTEKPQRMDISMMLALCDILGCQLTDLAVPVDEARAATRPKTARKKAVGDDVAPELPAVPRGFFDRP